MVQTFWSFQENIQTISLKNSIKCKGITQKFDSSISIKFAKKITINCLFSMNSVIRRAFPCQNKYKDLDPSCKTDLGL